MEMCQLVGNRKGKKLMPRWKEVCSASDRTCSKGQESWGVTQFLVSLLLPGAGLLRRTADRALQGEPGAAHWPPTISLPGC